MDELREAAESMKRSYTAHDPEKASDEANTIHNPVVKGSEAQRQDVTPATAEHQVSAPAHTRGPLPRSHQFRRLKSRRLRKSRRGSARFFPASSDKA